MTSDTFIAKCIAGKAQTSDIDIYIERWYTSNTATRLYDYLGMSWEEYDRWMQTPDGLDEIIESRRNRKHRK